MRSRRIAVGALAVLASLSVPAVSASAHPAVSTTVAAKAAATIPMPEQDPFYAVPDDIARYKDGQVIRARQIKPMLWALPLPANAWQIEYRTEDRLGKPTAMVTTVLVPQSAWHGSGARPLISYQTAEDGVSGKCAPSYQIRAGAQAEPTNATAETSEMFAAVAQGWAVTAPDYEGPQSEFLVAKTEAHGVLDAIRATLAFKPAGLSQRSPVGVWGYSGGSFASVVAAEYQKSYAPDLTIRAIALGGLVGSVRASISDFSGTVFGGTIAMGINGFERAYPRLDIPRYLTATGNKDVKAAAHDCISDAVPRYPFLSFKDIESKPNVLNVGPVATMLEDNSPLGIRGTPTAPIYDYHADGDELAPIKPALALLRRFCRSGAIVQHVQSPVGEHISEVVTGEPGAMRFFANRFAGKTPIDTCKALLAQ
jgi:Secretory lipase